MHSSVFSKVVTTLVLGVSGLGISINANAGFLDSIYEAQNAISSINETVQTIRGSTQAVYGLSEDIGLTGSEDQDLQSNAALFEAGTVLYGKLQSTKLYSEANKATNPVAVLSADDIMIYMGNEENGYYHVESDHGEGWVSKLLVNAQ